MTTKYQISRIIPNFLNKLRLKLIILSRFITFRHKDKANILFWKMRQFAILLKTESQNFMDLGLEKPKT